MAKTDLVSAIEIFEKEISSRFKCGWQCTVEEVIQSPSGEVFLIHHESHRTKIGKDYKTCEAWWGIWVPHSPLKTTVRTCMRISVSGSTTARREVKEQIA